MWIFLRCQKGGTYTVAAAPLNRDGLQIVGIDHSGGYRPGEKVIRTEVVTVLLNVVLGLLRQVGVRNTAVPRLVMARTPDAAFRLPDIQRL